MSTSSLNNTPIIDFLAPRFRTLESSPFQRLRQILSTTAARRHTWKQLNGTDDPYRDAKLRELAEPMPVFKGFFTGQATINNIDGRDTEDSARNLSARWAANSNRMIGENEEPAK